MGHFPCNCTPPHCRMPGSSICREWLQGRRSEIGNFWMGREERPLTRDEIIAGSERLTSGMRRIPAAAMRDFYVAHYESMLAHAKQDDALGLSQYSVVQHLQRELDRWKGTEMSFSVSFVGKPDALKRALAAESERLTGQSKEEFDAVKPAIETILDQNVNLGGDPSVFRVDANGHANFKDGVKQYGNCVVNVQRVGILVE